MRGCWQYQRLRSRPKLEAKIAELEHDKASISITNLNVIAEYHSTKSQLDHLARQMRHIIHQPVHVMPFLQPGRLMRFLDESDDEWGWGIVIDFKKDSAPAAALDKPDIVNVETLMPCAVGSAAKAEVARKPIAGQPTEMKVRATTKKKYSVSTS